MGFTDKKQNVAKGKRRGASYHESAVTILTPGCHFDGKLYCKGSSRIGGRIEGEIVSEGLLIIEEEAIINAQIRADEAIIQGRVRGRLEAKGRVELTETCFFEGDLITPVLVVVEGAKFNGQATMVTESATEQLPVVEKLSKKAVQGLSDSIRKVPDVGVGS